MVGSDAGSMKFTVPAGQLRNAVDRVLKVIPSSPSQVVYSAARLNVTDDTLTVTGSDEGEVTISVTVPVTDTASGNKLLLPRPLGAYLATLRPSTPVTVTAPAGPELQVTTADGSPYTFRLMEATFPNTSVPDDLTFDTDLSRLDAAVRAVKDTAAMNQIVQVVSTDSGVLLQATDGLRVARATVHEAHFGQFSGLLPLNVLGRMADSPMTTVAYDKRGRTITTSNDTVQVVARLVDDQFPNVSSILDDPPPHQVPIPPGPVLRALTRLSAVSDHRPVVVQLTGDRMRLSTNSGTVGSGAEDIDLDTPAPVEFTFGVNLGYFRDALVAHVSDAVTLGWGQPDRPVFLSSTGPLSVVTVVMPVVQFAAQTR